MTRPWVALAGYFGELAYYGYARQQIPLEGSDWISVMFSPNSDHHSLKIAGFWLCESATGEKGEYFDFNPPITIKPGECPSIHIHVGRFND